MLHWPVKILAFFATGVLLACAGSAPFARPLPKPSATPQVGIGTTAYLSGFTDPGASLTAQVPINDHVWIDAQGFGHFGSTTRVGAELGGRLLFVRSDLADVGIGVAGAATTGLPLDLPVVTGAVRPYLALRFGDYQAFSQPSFGFGYDLSPDATTTGELDLKLPVGFGMDLDGAIVFAESGVIFAGDPQDLQLGVHFAAGVMFGFDHGHQ